MGRTRSSASSRSIGLWMDPGWRWTVVQSGRNAEQADSPQSQRPHPGKTGGWRRFQRSASHSTASRGAVAPFFIFWGFLGRPLAFLGIVGLGRPTWATSTQARPKIHLLAQLSALSDLDQQFSFSPPANRRSRPKKPRTSSAKQTTRSWSTET